ncbi:MAG: Flagellar hook-length control protein-like protein [Firmicutes bacterium]|nr:Flagellar hook-length control protein-like protein [Bacillota bacterium]
MKAIVLPVANDIPLTNAPVRSSVNKSHIAAKGQQNGKKFDSVLAESVKASPDLVEAEKGSLDKKTTDQVDNALVAGLGGVVSLVKPVLVAKQAEDQPNPSVSAIVSKQEQNIAPVMVARTVSMIESPKPPMVSVQLKPEEPPTLVQNAPRLSMVIAQSPVNSENLIKPQGALNKVIPEVVEKPILGDELLVSNIPQDKELQLNSVSKIADAASRPTLNSLVNQDDLGLTKKINPMEQSTSQVLDASLVLGQNQESPISDFSPGDLETPVTAMQLNTAASSGSNGNAESGLTADTLTDKTELIRKPKENVGETTPFSSILDQHQGIKAEAINVARADALPQAPADRYNVLGQIVEQAKVINRPNNSEMVIKLKPEHLGELTLKIVVENGAVSATFLSNNSEVRSAIESSLPQLRQELSNQGLKVDQVGVYASMNQSFGNSHQRQSQYQEQPATITAESRDSKEFLNTVEMVAASASKNHIASSGIDYRI